MRSDSVASAGPTPVAAGHAHYGVSFGEFVALIAALMAVNALAIDVMLPALPQIGVSLAVADANGPQAVIISYLFGLGGAQLIFGPLSDRYGRRPILLAGLTLFVVAGLVAAFAQSFEQLLAARLAQGVGAAAPRVIAISLARDCYGGRAMGRVMSLAMMVFMSVPIVAPSLGQIILMFGSWRWVFGTLVIGGAALVAWTSLRLPETLPPQDRRSLSASAVGSACREVLTTRVTVGYMLAMSLTHGALFGFVTSAQQIFVDVFDTGRLFAVFFAMIAGTLGVAAFLNSRLVGRHGMRRLSHGATIAFIGINALHFLVALGGLESLAVFMVMQSLTLLVFGFIAPNFNALAMDPMGHIAGTASSLIGFFTTTAGAALGYFTGQAFDGSVLPFTLANLLWGAAALVVIFVTERGRLF
jgi:DHA1 family bicyclomycin/chloramphenicol resistance-like MFS transporter